VKLRKPRALPSLRLGGLSVRSFFRARLTAAALAALTIIPLLYSGLYLWSFWDPFDRMSNLPVALVNEDRPVKVDGEELNAGAEITDELLDGGDLNWKLMDAEEAEAGVADGRYYVSLTIPEDFSERLSLPGEDGAEPIPAMLEAHYNDANGYIVRQLMSSAFKEVRSAAADSAVAKYLDSMFVGFNDIHEATEKAADGASQLADGASEAKDGSSQLADGTSDAKDGADELNGGLGDAKDGSSELSSGIDQLYEGSKTLADGAGTASDGVSDAVDKLDPLADEWIPVLREKAPEIESGAQDVADAASALSDALADLPDDSAQAAQSARDLSERIQTRLDASPDLEQTDPDLYALLTDAKAAADQAAKLNDFVQANRDGISTVKDDADTVASLASDLAEKAPDLADDAEDARDKVNELDDGLSQLAEGSRDLRDGLEEASGGAGDLDSGLGQLKDGSGQLSDGLGLLKDGSSDLDSGLGQLKDGSGELSDGLADGVEEIPTFDDDDRDSRGDMMSQPVRLSSATSNEAPNYGTGFAPFFIALSLWVGAMMVFMVLPPLSRRALASTAPSWRIALAGWVPALLIGVAQVVVSLAALHFLLGLQASRWAATAGLLTLTVAAYAAVVQWANARFGSAGRVVALVLLMLQLTSAGGTYPIETSPDFFQAISPYLPMSWVVSALRVLISGGDVSVVLGACGVLTAYLVAFLLLTWLAVARKRMWTMTDLHPALKL